MFRFATTWLLLAANLFTLASSWASTPSHFGTRGVMSMGLLSFFKNGKDSAEVKAEYNDNVMNTYGRYKMTINKGKGCKLWDLDGNEYIDCTAGIATCCLGHAHPAMRKAVNKQMSKVHHCSNLYFIPGQAELAKWLVEKSCCDKAFFCNSGAEANEAAIKLARKYAHQKLDTEYPVIITALQSFHGRTLAAITATGQPKYQKDFGPMVPGFEYVEYNNVQDLQKMVAEINARPGQKLAAIMMEPLQGEGGIKPGTTAFFSEIRKICDETGALMIADEVQAGMGRTGKMWGHEHFDLDVDVITTAKALGGGLPIGAMLCKEKCNVFGPGDHATTYGGNPLACASALAVRDVMEKDNLIGNVNVRGQEIVDYAKELQKKYPGVISDIRGRGLLLGVELSEACPMSAQDVTLDLIDQGLLVVPAGPKVVRFVPPLIISKKEVSQVMSKFENSIAKCAAAM